MLIFTSKGRLGMDYIEEAKTRQLVVIPFLCDVLTNSVSVVRKYFGHRSSNSEQITVP